MTSRRHDWPFQLLTTTEAMLGTPFEWGVNDCALFAAGAVKAMTGFDPARGFRGYRSEAEGLRKVKAKGFADHVAVFEARFERATRLCAGDIAVIETGEIRALGVVQGRGIYVMHPERGLVLLPLSHAAWGMVI